MDVVGFDELSSDSGHSLALVSRAPCNQYWEFRGYLCWRMGTGADYFLKNHLKNHTSTMAILPSLFALFSSQHKLKLNCYSLVNSFVSLVVVVLAA